MLLWQRLAAALTGLRAAAAAPGMKARGVDTLSDECLRDLGLDRDQVGGNITFAKGDHQRFF
jgi:hypothetical protein